jgi:hypothetical protein
MKTKILLICSFLFVLFTSEKCVNSNADKSAFKEQQHTEANQSNLNSLQPAPTISWSLERDNLIKRFKLQNDRSVIFFMYVFIEGISEPLGYYQVNKISSVNSQLTNTEQVINLGTNIGCTTLPSPAEDGSYGTNGDAVFGFTSDGIYIEHNMKYIVSTVTLSFRNPVNKLAVISVSKEKELKELMARIK